MTLERAIEILESVNKLMRKEYSYWIGPKLTQCEITEAIDTVVKHFNCEKEAKIGYWKE